MIDPASAIAIATTAFTGIKKAVAAGKEISQLGKDISSFGKAVSDLDYMGNKAKDPPLWRKLDPKFDTSAIEIWAWESIVQIEAEQRRMQKEMVYRRQEKIDNLINWIIGIVLVVTGLGIFVAIIWFVGKSQGRW